MVSLDNSTKWMLGSPVRLLSVTPKDIVREGAPDREALLLPSNLL